LLHLAADQTAKPGEKPTEVGSVSADQNVGAIGHSDPPDQTAFSRAGDELALRNTTGSPATVKIEAPEHDAPGASVGNHDQTPAESVAIHDDFAHDTRSADSSNSHALDAFASTEPRARSDLLAAVVPGRAAGIEPSESSPPGALPIDSATVAAAPDKPGENRA
jgi:hypothetical protein